MKKLFSLLLLLTLSFTLAGCEDSSEYSYSDFTHLTNFSQIQTQDEEVYLVHYYSLTCSHCELVKPTILEFADTNTKGVKVYFIDAYNVTGTNYVDGMDGTPALLTISNGLIVDMNVGSVNIPLVLEDIEQGQYAYTN